MLRALRVERALKRSGRLGPYFSMTERERIRLSKGQLVDTEVGGGCQS